MRKFYFEESAKLYGANKMMKFEVAIVDCIDIDVVFEVIEVVQSNCCSDLLEALKKDPVVKKALRKYRNKGGILCVTCIS